MIHYLFHYLISLLGASFLLVLFNGALYMGRDWKSTSRDQRIAFHLFGWALDLILFFSLLSNVTQTAISLYSFPADVANHILIYNLAGVYLFLIVDGLIRSSRFKRWERTDNSKLSK